MRALSKLWQLFAIAALPNILSSWAGAVWGNKELSRALNTIVIALLAAAIQNVRLATDALASADPPQRNTRRDAIAWALHRLGREAEAADYVAKALRLGSIDPILRYHAGAIEVVSAFERASSSFASQSASI